MVQKNSAVRRGLIGASVGLAVMILVVFFTAASGGGFGLISFFYILAGPFYGFGFTFANWHRIMEKTKRGAKEGAVVFGIGVLLSTFLDDRRYGIWGWIYFLFRVSWHIGIGWIPGIGYGISAISQELREREEPTGSSASGYREQYRDEPRLRAQAAAQGKPALTCVGGVFAGAEFPIQTGEKILIGSDPASCQIVLPGGYAGPVQCALRYNQASCRWQGMDLSGGGTLLNGIRPLAGGNFQDIPAGSTVCIGEGKNAQRFRLG